MLMKAHSLMFYKLSLKITRNIKSERTDFCEGTPGGGSAVMGGVRGEEKNLQISKPFYLA